MLEMKTVYIHTYGHTGIFLCNANSSCTVYTSLGYLLGTTQLPSQMWIIEGAVSFIHLLCHSLRKHRMVTLTLSLVLKIQLELKSMRAVGLICLVQYGVSITYELIIHGKQDRHGLCLVNLIIQLEIQKIKQYFQYRIDYERECWGQEKNTA